MQRSQNFQNDLEKENQIKGLILPDFKTYYKAMLIKSVWYWHKDRHIDQWNRRGNSEIKPSHMWLHDFRQGCQDQSVEKGQSFQ